MSRKEPAVRVRRQQLPVELAIATLHASMLYRTAGINYADPQLFCDEHPDPEAGQKVLCAAYNRALRWPALRDTFQDLSRNQRSLLAAKSL